MRRNAATFLDAFLEVTSSLADEVSSGALDFASSSVDILLPTCIGYGHSSPNAAENRKGDEQNALVELFVSRLIERLNDAEVLVRNEVCPKE